MLRNEWLARLDGLVVFRGLLSAEPLGSLRAALAATGGAGLVGLSVGSVYPAGTVGSAIQYRTPQMYGIEPSTTNIIGSGLHHILQCSKMALILQNHFHADQVADVIFILIQFLGFFSGNPQVSASVHFNIIYIINPVKFQDHKILKKFHVTDFQLFHTGVERTGVQAESAGRTVRTFDLPAGSLANLQDVRPFAGLQGVVFGNIKTCRVYKSDIDNDKRTSWNRGYRNRKCNR